MKIKHMLASVAVSLLIAPAAMAMEAPQDKAIDKQGRPILDARGNCVLTKWESHDNSCDGMKRDLLRLSKEERTVYFDFNKSSIKASEKTKLDSLVRAIHGSKEVLNVDIVGHADKIGSSGYNSKLSRKRAEAVRSYLGSKGVKTRKVDMRALGENAPVTHCDNDMPRAELISCLAADRRVEIELNFAK